MSDGLSQPAFDESAYNREVWKERYETALGGTGQPSASGDQESVGSAPEPAADKGSEEGVGHAAAALGCSGDTEPSSGLTQIAFEEPRVIAALFVDPEGVYADQTGVEVWDEERDARLYDGPWPVVAHPPCARWSRLAGFTEARFGYKRGEDGGCFEAALNAVHKFGGVIEHPAYSQAWDRYELPKPKAREGWNISLDGGASCYIEQGRYGLPVKKATWLYAYGVALPKMEWGYTPDGEGLEPNTEWGGLENWRDRWQAGKKGEHPNAIGSAWMRGNRHNGMRSSTPPPFRDALICMARSVYDMREVAA